jgi:hypothetical protein
MSMEKENCQLKKITDSIFQIELKLNLLTIMYLAQFSIRENDQ